MNDAILDNLPLPKPAFPLTAVLQYGREDGVLLTIFHDGQLSVTIQNSEPITGTISAEQIALLITSLIEEGVVKLGLTSFDIQIETEKQAVAAP